MTINDEKYWMLHFSQESMHLPEASVLFADIVGFTPFAAEHCPEQVVKVLNDIFSAFDSLAADLGLEKIKTIGDSYMVVGCANATS